MCYSTALVLNDPRKEPDSKQLHHSSETFLESKTSEDLTNIFGESIKEETQNVEEERSILLDDTELNKPDIRVTDDKDPSITHTNSNKEEAYNPKAETFDYKPSHQTEDLVPYDNLGSVLILDRKHIPTAVTSVKNTQNDSLTNERSKKTVIKTIVDIDNAGTRWFVNVEDWGPRLKNSPCFCKECGILFATSNNLLDHNTTAHSCLVAVKTKKPKNPSKVITKNTDNEKRDCNVVFPNRDSLFRHQKKVRTQHSPEKNKAPIVKKLIKKKKNPQDNVQSQPIMKTGKVLVAKSVIFKCSKIKCSIHFVDCTTASLHTKSCNWAVERSWKCYECDKVFTLQDQQYHLLQHQFSSKRFITYFSGDKTLGRILNKCPDCETYLHEHFFKNHRSAPCIKESVMCGFCKLEIHQSSIEEHYEWHVKLNLSTLKDFIIVEFEKTEYQSSTDTSTSLDSVKRKNDDIDEVNAKRRRKNLIKVYCCMNCSACSIGYRRLMHAEGKCVNIKKFIKICYICGLPHLHTKPHKKFHDRNPKLTIMDMQFIREDAGEVMTPPVPPFPRCKNCGVHFLIKPKTKHYCSYPYKSCEYCKELFNDSAYQLHIKYHEYAAGIVLSPPEKIPFPSQRNKPKILKNRSRKPSNPISNIQRHSTITLQSDSISQDIWSVLYRCESCDIVFGSYDTTVEHCQKHINFMESNEAIVGHCQVCCLKLNSACFVKHKELHTQNKNIKKESFKILTFKYTDLLSAHWLYFLMLKSNVIDQITASSVYLHTRKVKMRMVKDGAPESTLFKCCKCDKYVHPTAVYIHSRSDACIRNSRTFSCSICNICFTTVTGKSQHENLHNTFNNFKVVHFNEPGDDYFNEALCRWA